MKKVTKIIALLLAVGLLFLTYGCQGNKSTTETVGSTSKVDSQASGSVTEGTASNGSDEVKLPDLQLKSKTVKVLRRSDVEYTKEELKVHAILKENYGVEVETVAIPYWGAQYMTKLTQYVVSGDTPDLVSAEVWIHPTAAVKKVVQPVDEYMDFNLPLFKDVKVWSDKYKWAGKHYAIITGSSIFYYIWYNKKLFEENGVETPLDYFKRDEWTWDTLRKLAEEMTLDTNGDGKTDVYGIGRSDAFNVTLCSTGTDYVKFTEDGKILNNMSDPQFKWAAEFASSLKSPGWEYPLGQCYEQFQKGELAMFEGGCWAGKQYKKLLDEGAASFVPLPKNSQADKWYIQHFAGGYYILEGAKNPEGAVAYIASEQYKNYLDKNSPDYETLRKNQMKDDWGITDAEVEMVDFAVNKCTPSYIMHIGVGGWMQKSWAMADELYQGVPFATVVDKYSPVLDAEIKKMYE